MTISKEYTLGLDIGTQSVGWAVLDQDNNLVKKYGHYLWGVRMFDESKDAKERRLNRCNRRRYQRRRERIELLRELFKKEIDKVDPNFFIRLDDSFYDTEDSRVKNKNVLDGYLSNSKFNKEYGPTIWHLRKHLIESKNEKVDIRLLYLAIHHIIKYRGNFLSQVGEFDVKDSSELLVNIENFNESIRNQRAAYEAILGNDEVDVVNSFLTTIENPSLELIGKIEEILDLKEIELNGIKLVNATKKDKRNNLTTLLNGKGTIIEDLFVNLLVNGECDFSKFKIFKTRAEKPSIKIIFSSDDFDGLIQQATSDNPTEYNLILAVASIKNIYERFYLKKLIGNNQFISFAMVDKYNKYKNDLSSIKKLFKKYLPERYSSYFRELDSKYENYAAYTGSTNYESKTKHKQVKEKTKRIPEDIFFGQLKKELDSIIKIIESNEKTNTDDIALCEEIKTRIDDNDFLQRIRSKHNGTLPYQLHELELKTILSNQTKFYSFLNEGDPTTTSKILSLLRFKRPYFVGPIAGHGDNKWAIFKVGKENERAYPWNFEDIIDFDASASEFIHRMQNKCTFLKGEKDYCLPKYSIIYQAYNVFNYINKIKVNGGSLDKETKQKVIDLFLNNKTVTSKRIAKTINPTNPDSVIVSDCNVSLSTYVTFNQTIPEFANNIDKNIDLIEEIIENVTLFEDKVMLEKRIREIAKEHNVKLSEESIKKIKGFSFNGYGRLCKKLLLGLSFFNKETGENYSNLISYLTNTNYNFMEAFNDSNLTFREEVEKYNQEYSTLKDLGDDEESFNKYVEDNIRISPIWIRPFIQSYKIIKEVEKLLGTEISYYAVECTREDDPKKKKQQSIERKNQIATLLNAAKELRNELLEHNIDIKRLSNELDSKENLNEDKLFLYFQQMGKDMYTLEDIDINELSQKYDIDHIYPQSLVKDDSISNRVLTRRDKNNAKQNELLPNLVHKGFLAKNAYSFYKLLYKNKMITKAKYERLTEKEVNEVAINDFVARQKTATDQAVKALIDALKEFKHVDSTRIIYSKANVISEFRHKNRICKSREANNFHHAHDAYLNAFIGKTLQKYFASIGSFIASGYNPNDFFEDEKNDSKYTRNIANVLSHRIRRLPGNNIIVWNGQKDINKIKKNIQTNFDIRETRLTTRKNTFISQVTNGGKNGKSNVPIKSITPNGNEFDIKKYGGYGSPSYIYMQIFECKDKKGNISYQLIPINKLYFVDKDAYLKPRLPKNCIYKCLDDDLIINFNSVFVEGKKEYRITGTSGKTYLILNNKERIFAWDVYQAIYAFNKMKERLVDRRVKEEQKWKFVNDKDKGFCCLIYSNKKDESKKFLLAESQLKLIYNDLLNKIKEPCFDYSPIKNAFGVIDSKYCDFVIDNGDKFKLMFQTVDQILGILKVNERKTINLTKIYSEDEIKNMEQKTSTQAAVLTSGTELKPGTKIYSYSPTGFYRKLLFEVK